MTVKRDERKVSIYIKEDMLAELRAEGERQERTLSWLVRMAWKIARKKVMGAPSATKGDAR